MDNIITFSKIGGPEVLQFEQVPTLEPGPGEVRIKMKAIGINRAESMYRQAQYVVEPKLPSRIGVEGVGIVERIGAGVTQVQIGDHVAMMPSQSMNDYATYGDAAIFPADSVVKYPENVSPTIAAASFVQYLTTYFAFVEIGKVQPGHHVLLTAASGGVGAAGIEILHLLGAKAIATTRTSAKRQSLLDLGADEVIVTEEEDLSERVMQITNGKGAELIFDAIAGATIDALAASVAWGGKIIIYGALDENPTVYPLFPAFFRNFSLESYMIYNFTGYPALGMPRNEAAYQRGVDFVVKALSEGKLNPVIAKTFPLDEIVEAVRYLESNQQVGKVVVTVGS
jgi:NADPH2:quinone reductase